MIYEVFIGNPKATHFVLKETHCASYFGILDKAIQDVAVILKGQGCLSVMT